MLQGCCVGDQHSAFGAFAGTLRILITDVNDNAPIFQPISETFGEQPGLVCAVGSPPPTHALPCSLVVRTSLQPGQGCKSAGARLGLLNHFQEGCGAEGGVGMLGALLSPGAMWAQGLQQAWLHTSMTALSACLSPQSLFLKSLL